MFAKSLRRAALALASVSVLVGCNLAAVGVQMAQDKQREDEMRRQQAIAQHDSARRQQENEAAVAAEKKAYKQAIADIQAAATAKDAAKILLVQEQSKKAIKKSEYLRKLHEEAAVGVVQAGDFKTFANEYLLSGPRGSGVTLETVEARVGDKALSPLAKAYFKETKFDRKTGYGQYDALVDYLTGKKAMTADLCPSVLRHLDEGVVSVSAMHTAGELKCRVAQKKLANHMVSDNWRERRASVWVVGQLEQKSLKKKIEAVRWNDPKFDQGCLCYPVRDEAAKVLTRFTE